ncbi:hypothetical protein GGI12_003184 [Dipsacomyces acuminosporus]|nr:hypothetical protein GGI12_003184 [Dipsacomyces acuminosporus]
MFTPRQAGGGGSTITTPQSVGTPQTPRINDDAAERRRRRKSAIERRRSTLVTPHRPAPKTSLFSPSPQLMSPGPFAVQLPRLTPEELNQRYEEWMKIAADNKINANNTWDFALIDYFYDMSLLRDGDSINFQKASCTLDGCVKIYSSRVDSVASETGRLLSGLAEAPGKRGSDRRASEDGEGAEEGGDKQRSRRANRAVNTLAKDFASISVKKLDLEFSVDPLFKKTSADFDEGGARGLLLNHLCFDADGKIVFDASDAKTPVDDEGTLLDEASASFDIPDGDDRSNADDSIAAEHARQRPAAPKKHRPSLIDISSMEGLFNELTRYLDSAHICPSLSDFEFTCDTSLDFALLKEHLRDDCEPADGAVPGSTSNGSVDGEGADGFDNLSDFGAGGDGDDMGHFLNFDEADIGPVPIETAATLQLTENEEAEDQTQQLSALPSTLQLAVDGDEDSLLSYFDTKLTKGWAGPEYWKLPISRAVMKQQQQQQQQQQSGEDDANNPEESDSKRKRSEKQVYFTDFINGDDASAESLFIKPARASAITMSKKAIMNQEHTLPEDVHFSSKNLFNLLLKPKLKFNTRKPRVAASAAAPGGTGAEGAGNGTSAYGGFVVDGDDAANIISGAGDDDHFGGAIDRPDFDDADDFDDDVVPLNSGDAEADPANSGVPQLKLVKPLYVNYARRAKRVNVKKLKENIWREMAIGDRRKSAALLAGTGGEPDELSPADVSPEDDTIKLQSKQKFSEVVGSLKNVYPREKLEELSISYCFICLLHLANERNLRIVGDSSLRDLVITQDSFD